MKRHDEIQQVIGLLHDARQPLNVMNLSCANVRARTARNSGEVDPEHLLLKIGRIEQQIEKESRLLDEIHSLLTELR